MRKISYYIVGIFIISLLYLPTAGAAASIVRGNAKSMIYHNSNCKYFNCKACTAVFASAAEAKAKGYKACKVCKG